MNASRRFDVRRGVRSPPARAVIIFLMVGPVTLGGCEAQLITEGPSTIDDAFRDIQNGFLTCEGWLEQHLTRISLYEGDLHALTSENPAASMRAAELDVGLENGEPLESLTCVPILVQDNIDTGDLYTTAGSEALGTSRPPDDATIVARVRGAGGIVAAKANMAEWGLSARRTASFFGTTRNAYALDRGLGGASGGIASGVSAGLGVAGLGMSSGNDVRGPASHAGVVGLRPTLGLVSRDGLIPVALDRDVPGIVAGSVTDVARVLDVIAGSDPKDPSTVEADALRAADYTEYLTPIGLEGIGIGVVRAAEVDTAVSRLFEEAVEVMRELGAQIVDPLNLDLQSQLAREGLTCDRFRYDVARYLATLDDPPIADVAEVLESRQYSAHVEADLRRLADAPVDTPPAEWDPPCPDFTDNEARTAFREVVVAAMDAAEVHAIAYPSWPCPPPPLEEGDQAHCPDDRQWIAPLAGAPAITVPMGLTGDGLPAGLGLLARRYHDARLLGFAYAYEQDTQHRQYNPPLPPRF